MSYGADKLKMGVNSDFKVKFDFKGQGRSLHNTIGISAKVFYIPDLNLVILAWTGDELSNGETLWWTDLHTQTEAGNRNVLQHVKCEHVRVKMGRRVWRHQNMCTL